jgi:ribosomal protein L16 Arg81 hydroxylase
MLALWILQGFVNLIGFSFIVVWLYARRQNPKSLMTQLDDKFQQFCRGMENRLERVETESQIYRRQLESQLKRLGAICDQATEVLHRGIFVDINHGPTVEETEIKAALSNISASGPLHIPTIEQLERTKARLRTEAQMDLRTLLQDQLS